MEKVLHNKVWLFHTQTEQIPHQDLCLIDLNLILIVWIIFRKKKPKSHSRYKFQSNKSTPRIIQTSGLWFGTWKSRNFHLEEYICTFNCSCTKANWVWQMRRDSKFLTNSLNSIQNSPSSDLLLVMCSYLRVLHSSLLSDQLPVHSLVPWGFLTLTSLRPSLHNVTLLIISEELFLWVFTWARTLYWWCRRDCV